MTTRTLRLGVPVLAMLGLALTAGAPAAFTGRDLIAMATNARACDRDATTAYRLVLGSKGGDEVSRTIVAYQKKAGYRSKRLIFFREPEDLAGTGLLVWITERGPEQWIYLPELGRVRQINPIAQGESFMGTDFTYADLGEFNVDARAHELVGEEDMDGQPTYKIVSTPRWPSAYSKVLTWVSRETFLPVLIEYYDTAGALLKTGRVGDVRPVFHAA